MSQILILTARTGMVKPKPIDSSILEDRRAAVRFPIALEAEIRIGKNFVRGTTANIGGGGLFMSCGQSEIRVGRDVEVRIKWPRSRPRANLALIIEGSIIRCESGFVAIRRLRHEFVETEGTTN
jgi:hypothetical protein